MWNSMENVRRNVFVAVEWIFLLEFLILKNVWEGSIMRQRNFKRNVANPLFLQLEKEKPWNCTVCKMINNPEQSDTSYNAGFKPTVDTYVNYTVRWSAFSSVFLQVTCFEKHVQYHDTKVICDSKGILPRWNTESRICIYTFPLPPIQKL